MKTVAYSSPMIPPEWIAAHGLRPWRVLPGQRTSAASQGVCPFSQAFMDDVCGMGFQPMCLTGILPVSFDAVILATTCDQMRRAGEMLSSPPAMPAFLMNVPVTWQSPAAAQMYQDELRRLGRFLVQIGGKAPSDETLIETMTAFQCARQTLLDNQDRLPARRFVELIFQLCQSSTTELCGEACGEGVPPSCVAGVPPARGEGILPSCLAGVPPAVVVSSLSSLWQRRQGKRTADKGTAAETTGRNNKDEGEALSSHADKMSATHESGTPSARADRMPAAHTEHGQDARATLAVVGGPMTARDLCVLDMLEQGGGRIVLNASESGQRCLPASWGNRGPDSPLATLAAAYFGAIPDAFRRPDDLLYEYLRRELAARQVRGIVFVRQAWCDLWHAQASRMRSAFALPLLDLDVSCPDSASVSLSNRIQSFLEVLR